MSAQAIKKPPLVFGGLSTLLGLLVLVGWWTHSSSLIQVHPTFVPMQFNTALGFLLGGAGLIALSLDRRAPALALAAVMGAIGLFTLVEYVTGVDLGLDQLLMEHYITVKTPYPGRMAANTAVCFSLVGLSLILAAGPRPLRWRRVAAALLAAASAGLAVVALLGYWSGVETAYGWGRLSSMAIHTAVGFGCLASGQLWLVWQDAEESWHWQPIVAGTALTTASVVLAQALLAHETNQVLGETQASARHAAFASGEVLENHLLAIERMARRYEKRPGGTPRSEWEQDAARYVKDIHSFLAVECVDFGADARWIVTREGEEALGARDLFQVGHSREALEAGGRREPTVTACFDLPDGTSGFIVHAPIYAEGEFLGAVVAVLGVRRLLDPVLANIAPAYAAEVFEGDQRIYARGGGGEERDGPTAEAELTLGGVTWRLLLRPGPEVLAQTTNLSLVVLLGGLVLAVLAALGLYMSQAMRRGVRVRRAAEERLQLLGAAVHAAANAVVITDRGGRVEWINPAFTEITGYSSEEIVGQKTNVLKSGRHDAAFYEDMWETINSGRVWRGEMVNQRKDGTIYQEEQTITPIRGPEGEIAQFIAVKADVTARKESEEALDQSERRLRWLMDQVPAVVIMTDVEGRLTAVHGAGQVVDPAQATGRLLGSFVGEGEAPALEESFRRSLCGEVASFEVEVWGKSWETHMGPLRGKHDQIEGVICVALDMSERQLTESLSLAKERAELASQAKSQFLANMSHEIRTPMTGVLGMLDLLGSANLEERERGYVEMARSSADLLLRVIDDILDFSKIEAGKLELENTEFDLRSVVENTTLPIAQRAASDGLDVMCFVPVELPTALRGDPVRLAQILTNLLGNAVKFTKQGEVVLEVRAEEAGPGRVRLRFEVRDTGIGIEAAALSTLFDAFAQAESSTTRRYGGTGLGLTISRRLVEMLGGEIGAESVPGEGSTFWFTCSFEAGTPAARVAEQDLCGVRVLVVDDSATQRRILADYMASWGVRAEAASSRSETLRLLLDAHERGLPFELVILDHHMPAMDGISLARAIRGERTLAQTPLVLASPVGSWREEYRAQGIAAPLDKPVRFARLHRVLCRALSVRVSSTASLAAPAAPLLRGRVLLVDDMKVNQIVGQELLGQLGLEVDLVSNGLEAVRASEERRYDLVLMDCQMPELDGYQATLRIREREVAQNVAQRVPIVAITASALKDERDRCREAGMDGFIAKPFDQRALSVELERWLPRRDV